MKAPRPLEKECRSAIIAAARLMGYRVHGQREAQGKAGRWMTAIDGDAGFPDLVLVHPRTHQLIIRELKRHPNKVEPEQELWLASLSAAGIDAGVVWVPEQQDAFLAYLKAKAHG